ncbi:MAG: glutamate-1-semialdehyde 2,1-aminomutase [Myxococcaceae bacterium]
MPTGSTSRSDELFAKAVDRMPGGVSSPVRAFKKVGGHPLYLTRGEGSKITDEDGNSYTDYCLAWGPLILGHAHPAVVEAVTRAARDGLAFGTCHRNEITLADLVLEAFQPFERVRFVVSGTEAVMTALRLARSHTGRRKILKFKGCYHGHSDQMLVKAGSGIVTLGLADSEGVTQQAASDTVVIALGDEAALEAAFKQHGSELAAAIIEPVPANNGLLLQTDSYLKKLRLLTAQNGSLLIFDEVITGFRFGFHGYGKVCGVQPDLCTLGKVAGGGMPAAAVVGRRDILDRLAPIGSTYQAGTMAGNPVALAAGIACLSELKKGEVYAHLNKLGSHLEQKMKSHPLAKQAQVPRAGAMFWPYFDPGGKLPVEADRIVEPAVKRYHGAYRGWLERGLYLPPSAYEVSFLSAAHTTQDLDQLLDALEQVPAKA